jgi:SAM-dependent methyltransferase
MTTVMDWRSQVGRSWAQNYALTDRSFSGLTQVLLQRASLAGGRAVLDIGCGAGEVALAIARQQPEARVIGLDVSHDLIAVAQQRGESLHNLQFDEGDAASWTEPDFAPDLLISRHGVMFFPDPVEAFAHLHGLVAADGRLLFSCFRAPMENSWAAGLAQVLDLPPPADPAAPGPFAFADRVRVQGILRVAGWQDIVFDAVDFAYVAGHGEDPIEDALQLFRRIGPAAPYLRNLEGAAQAAAEERIRGWLADHRDGNLVAMAAAAWLVSARA